MKRSWADEAIALIGRGEAVALITLINVQGSAPRDVGARMLVWTTGQSGTIGGGNLELMLTQDARTVLAGGPATKINTYPLGPILGQCCGGNVEALIERLDANSIPWLDRAARFERDGCAYRIATRWAPDWQKSVLADPRDAGPGQGGEIVKRWPNEIVERVSPPLAPLYLFGAGHVGQAIARSVAPLPFRLCWFDTRADFANEAQLVDNPCAVVERAPAGAYFLVLTHNHDLDYEIVRTILTRANVAYCGLIGSKSKRARFVRQLRADGLGDELIRLTCPIGGSIGLKGKAPEIIAAATIAELLLVYEARSVTAPEAVHVE